MLFSLEIRTIFWWRHFFQYPPPPTSLSVTIFHTPPPSGIVTSYVDGPFSYSRGGFNNSNKIKFPFFYSDLMWPEIKIWFSHILFWWRILVWWVHTEACNAFFTRFAQLIFKKGFLFSFFKRERDEHERTYFSQWLQWCK